VTGVVVGSQGGGDGDVFADDGHHRSERLAAVAVTTADVYAFRRNAAGTGVDAAVYAPATNTWSAFAAPPPFGAGQGFRSDAAVVRRGRRREHLAVRRRLRCGEHPSSRLDTTRPAGPRVGSARTDTGTHLRRFIAGYRACRRTRLG